jgi:molecular chaperone HscB
MTNFNLLNHFEKFALTANFEIDLEQLEQKYLQLQKQFHPDALINNAKSDNDDLQSIAINEAYQILKNPSKRAVYLLKLKGINIDDDHCLVKPDEETLMLILELKESLFAKQDSQEAAKIKAFATHEIKELFTAIKADFHNQNYSLAAQKLIKVKYLEKILLDIKLMTMAL